MRKIIGLYGNSGCGKTTYLVQTILHLSRLGVRCSGVISPSQFAENQKIGIYSRILPSGEQKLLASLAKPGDSDTLGKWKMFPETIVWVKNHLYTKTPCDLWIIDEIGPYELEQKKAGLRRWILYQNTHAKP